MPQPAISVAMSVYNNADYLALAIESILAQTFRDFEFLILNDGSTDDSAAIINRYAARDSRIRPIHRANKGLIVSLNQLVEEARAPLIARMDGDDIALPERFERQVAFLRDNPDYGVTSTWTHDIDGQGNPYAVTGKEPPITHEDFVAAIEEGPLLCHPSVLFRRDLVLQVGGYHAAFKHCEDYDLWLRLAAITKLGSIPERLMRYRHTEGQVSSRHIVVQQYGAAVSWFALKEREAGRHDPTETLDNLPPLGGLDTLFGRPGMDKAVIGRVAPRILYSKIALTSSGFDMVINHVREGHHINGIRRTVLRLLRMGEPLRAVKLATALVGI
jgi:glycosyltransferase involved in cell wall biosynthesis